MTSVSLNKEMHKKTLCFVCLHNEEHVIRKTLSKFTPELFGKWIDELIVIDDCSSDNSGSIVKEFPCRVIRHPENRGVGAAFKTAVEYARKNGYEVIISVAGNNKMEPSEIPALLRPIFDEGYHFVQGSRYLKNGHRDNIPYQRYIIQRVGSGLIRLIFGWPGNDVSCGFRAVSMEVFNHPQVNIFQDWLERYGLESYIQFKAIQYGFRIKQVPASMIYPSDKKIKYTKIPSLRGWWDMAYPWIALSIGIKK